MEREQLAFDRLSPLVPKPKSPAEPGPPLNLQRPAVQPPCTPGRCGASPIHTSARGGAGSAESLLRLCGPCVGHVRVGVLTITRLSNTKSRRLTTVPSLRYPALSFRAKRRIPVVGFGRQRPTAEILRFAQNDKQRRWGRRPK